MGGLAYHEGKRYASHPLQAPETPRNDPQHQTTPPPGPRAEEMLRALFRLLVITAITGILAAGLLLYFLEAWHIL